MRIAPELREQVMPFDVAGANPRRWNAPLSFGPWATTEVREGLTWGFGARLLGVEARYATQPYRLVLSGGSKAPLLQAECMTRAASLSRHDLSVDPTLGTLPALSCGFAGAGDGTLRLHTTASNTQEGDIAFGDNRWQIRSVRVYEGSPLPSGDPLGYEVRRDAQIVAAVETINRGRVWISPSLSAQSQAQLAAVIAALLLYEPPPTS